MDSFELNKILGAVLGICLVLLSLNITANAIFAPHKPAKPGYDIAVPDQPADGKGGAPAAAEPPKPIAELLAASDVARGETSAKKCAACHTFNKGGPNRVGPNLWGIVGRAKASVAGLQLLRRDEGARAATGAMTISTPICSIRRPWCPAPTCSSPASRAAASAVT